MITRIFSQGSQRFVSLPVLGPLMDRYAGWLYEQQYTRRSTRYELRMKWARVWRPVCSAPWHQPHSILRPMSVRLNFRVPPASIHVRWWYGDLATGTSGILLMLRDHPRGIRLGRYRCSP